MAASAPLRVRPDTVTVLPVPTFLSAKAPVALPVLGVTFLKIGLVSFGSGYVLLAFLRADFVLGLHWLSDRQALSQMSANARRFARPDAAEKIVRSLERWSQGRRAARERAAGAPSGEEGRR